MEGMRAKCNCIGTYIMYSWCFHGAVCSYTPPAKELDPAGLPPACRWILSRLSSATAAVVAAMEAYDFSTATQRLYAWWQYEVCDVFIEVMKPVMNAPEGSPVSIALIVLIFGP